MFHRSALREVDAARDWKNPFGDVLPVTFSLTVSCAFSLRQQSVAQVWLPGPEAPGSSEADRAAVRSNERQNVIRLKVTGRAARRL